MKKYYYVYAYSHDNSGFYGENNYISTEFSSGVTEFKEIQTEADIKEFADHIYKLENGCRRLMEFKSLISWQEVKMLVQDEKTLEILRKNYPKGTRVELVLMNDPYTKLKSGDKGFVDYIDDACGIHIRWDNGEGLAAIHSVDIIKKVVSNREWLNSLNNTEAAKIITNIMYKIIVNNKSNEWNDILYNELIENWLNSEKDNN